MSKRTYFVCRIVIRWREDGRRLGKKERKKNGVNNFDLLSKKGRRGKDEEWLDILY
jgi:hypothetical protein